MSMDKRDFLKTSGALLAGTVLARYAGAQPELPQLSRTNWSGNYTYKAAELDQPDELAQLQGILRSQAKFKALGARHSFNGIADTPGAQVSLKHFDQMELDSAAKLVKVGAGVTYGHLAPYIDSRGFAVHNLASLPHIGVVGACATATHGSGSSNGNLSTAVRAIDIVTPAGEMTTLSRSTMGDQFAGAVVALGALGVITGTTLAVEPRFEVEQTLYENLSFSQLEHNLEAIFASGYSVSLFTDWQGGRATQVWIKQRVGAAGPKLPAEFYGARAATRKLHPIAGHAAESCTEQLGVPGPWYERLPHFKMNFVPSSGAELQTEYFVPREHGYRAIRAVEELRDQITPHLFVTEFRTIAADDLWISPCYQRDAMTLHFTWKPEWEAVRPILPQIEAKLAPFAVRPHWAKLFTLAPASIRQQYARMPEFLALVAKYDPQGKLRNAYLEKNLYSA